MKEEVVKGVNALDQKKLQLQGILQAVHWLGKHLLEVTGVRHNNWGHLEVEIGEIKDHLEKMSVPSEEVDVFPRWFKIADGPVKTYLEQYLDVTVPFPKSLRPILRVASFNKGRKQDGYDKALVFPQVQVVNPALPYIHIPGAMIFNGAKKADEEAQKKAESIDKGLTIGVDAAPPAAAEVIAAAAAAKTTASSRKRKNTVAAADGAVAPKAPKKPRTKKGGKKAAAEQEKEEEEGGEEEEKSPETVSSAPPPMSPPCTFGMTDHDNSEDNPLDIYGLTQPDE